MAELDGIATRLISRPSRWQTLLRKSDQGLDVYSRKSGEIIFVAGIAQDLDESSSPGLLQKLNAAQVAKTDVVLRLAPELALRRKVTLPAAAREILEPVLENQLERIVPWPTSQTYFGYEIIDEARSDDKIVVRLVAVKQHVVDDACAQAKSLGFEPEIVDIADAVEQAAGIRLTNLNYGAEQQTSRHTAKAIVFLVMISLGIGGLGLWQMAKKQSALVELETRIARLETHSSEVRKLRAKNSALPKQIIRLVNKRKGNASIAIVIDNLTRILPDDAQLTKLEIRGNKIHITGVAKNAAELIGALERSRHFVNVRFASPTIRRPGDFKEAFSIEAETVPGRHHGEM